MVRVVMAFMVALLVAHAVAAAPSFLGFTGLLRVPTADTLNLNEFNVAWFNVDLAGGNENAYAANMGLRDGLEVGVLRSRVERAEGETMLNVKYRIQPETPAHAGLAVGVFDPTNEVESTAYFVASKAITKTGAVFGDTVTAVRVHVGAGGGALDGVFAGASAVVGKRLLLAAEYDTHDVNLGGGLDFGGGVRGHVAWLNQLQDLGVGLSYNKMF